MMRMFHQFSRITKTQQAKGEIFKKKKKEKKQGLRFRLESCSRIKWLMCELLQRVKGDLPLLCCHFLVERKPLSRLFCRRVMNEMMSGLGDCSTWVYGKGRRERGQVEEGKAAAWSHVATCEQVTRIHGTTSLQCK